MLSEQDVDRELKAALSVSPSPGFEARVLQRVEAERPSRRPAHYGWLAAAASLVIAAGVFYAMNRTPSSSPRWPQRRSWSARRPRVVAPPETRSAEPSAPARVETVRVTRTQAQTAPRIVAPAAPRGASAAHHGAGSPRVSEPDGGRAASCSCGQRRTRRSARRTAARADGAAAGSHRHAGSRRTDSACAARSRGGDGGTVYPTVEMKEYPVKRTLACIGSMVLIAALAGSTVAVAQETAKPLVPLKVQLVVSRYTADKKISSLPYTLWVTANEKKMTSHPHGRAGADRDQPSAQQGWRGPVIVLSIPRHRHEHRLPGHEPGRSDPTISTSG